MVLASYQWGLVTANGVELLINMYVIYMETDTSRQTREVRGPCPFCVCVFVSPALATFACKCKPFTEDPHLEYISVPAKLECRWNSP